VQEGQWRVDMVRLRDTIFYCSSCKAENFYDVDALRISGGKPTTCWCCGQRLVLPFRIRLGKHIVMLNHDTKLYPHHIEPQKRYDFSKPVAEVSRHPTNPNLWGLKNLSSEKWVAEKPDGTIQEVEVGRSLTLASGTKIHFGSSQGEIRYN
jgi:eukaryotic-like serine/threonine-protein kinase